MAIIKLTYVLAQEIKRLIQEVENYQAKEMFLH